MVDLVTIAPGHQLAPAPAASAQRMFAAGCPVAITSTYRSRAYQQHLRDLYLAGKGAFALPPGQSLHERGEAVDWKREAAEWVLAHPEYGWRFTNPDEWWHTDYVLALDRTLHTLTPITPEDDMPYKPNELAQIVVDALSSDLGKAAIVAALATPNGKKVIHDQADLALREQLAPSGEAHKRLLSALPAATATAVLDAEVPSHDELTGPARRVGFVLRDTRIQTRRIQDAVTEKE